MTGLTRMPVLPDVVDWRITSKCNRHCPFCYGPEVSDVSTADAMRVVDFLARMDVKVVGITGGEPFVRRDIVRVLRYVKHRGMKCCLSTNADLYPKYREDTLSLMDVVGLPVEGSTAEIHDSLRGSGSFKSVMTALRDIFENGTSPFRIGTVVTRLNYHDLPNIERLLEPFRDRIVYWKLYEFVPYLGRRRQRLDLVEPPEDCESYVGRLGHALGTDKVCFDTCEARSRSYFLVNPNGDAIVPVLRGTRTTDVIIGNLLTDSPDTVLGKWLAEIDIPKYYADFRCVFRRHSVLRKHLQQE